MIDDLRRRATAIALGMTAALVSAACSQPRRPGDSALPASEADVVAAIVPLTDSESRLRHLRELIGDRRIVLLGENGHGVGELTQLRAALTETLLESMGFTTVIFESGYHECDEADAALASVSPTSTLRHCLAYVFEHAEALPLFSYVRAARGRGRDVRIGGADLQAQGPASQSRPSRVFRSLSGTDPDLARLAQMADSGLLHASQLGGDSLRTWIVERGTAARAALERALPVIPSDERWRLRAALGLLTRGELRVASETAGEPVPVAYYAERDAFMARTVSWLADSVGASRKVIVWMHNDHVRLGRLESPAGPVDATGRLLARMYPRDVVSIGLFMGEGEVANNSRVVRPTLPISPGSLESPFMRSGYDAALLVLRDARSTAVQRWARSPLPYRRNGLALDTLRLADEFDAIVFSRRASPPTYRLPSP